MTKSLYRFEVKGYNALGFFEEYIIEANDMKNVCNLISDDFRIIKLESVEYSAEGYKYFNTVPSTNTLNDVLNALGEKDET